MERKISPSREKDLSKLSQIITKGAINLPKQTLPKKAFDTEYSTMWSKEHKYLKSKGIECSYVKNTRDYNVPVYKYKKTPALFIALFEFYTQVENERAYSDIEKSLSNSIDTNDPEKTLKEIGLKVVYEDNKPKFVECP